MKGIIGRVIEVYLPSKYNDMIGFKVKCEKNIINIVVPIEDETANIYKDDLVIIKKHIISNRDFITIERIDENEYE